MKKLLATYLGLSFVMFFGFWGMCVNGNVIAQECDSSCPFADDEIILYSSPSTASKISAFKEVWGSREVQDVAKIVANKIDESLENEKDEVKKSALNYLASVLCNASNTKSFAEAAFNCYFRYVDGVIVALDIPEKIEDPKNGLSGLSLTYILNADPSTFDVNKFVKETEDYEVIETTGKEKKCKFFVKEGGEIKATVFAGMAEVKDLNKYVIVVATTQEVLEKKIARFQATNEFVVNRMNDNMIYVDYIIKKGVFKRVAEKLEEGNDPNAKIVHGFVEKVNAFRFQAKGVENGVTFTSFVETSDEETAKNLCDLANGGLAVARLKVQEDCNLPQEAEIGVELLKKIKVTRDSNSTVGSLNITVEELKQFAKIVCAKILSANK